MKNLTSKMNMIRAAMLMAMIVLVFASCEKSDLNPIITGDTGIASEQKLSATPVVPEEIAVPDGTKLIWHTYALGAQIYEVTQSTTNPDEYVWTFVAPSATLYQKANFTKQVGIHYAGPTWEATIGSTKNLIVVGTKIASVSEDTTAIPWLLLQAVPGTETGYYSNITYIQRLYTTGGLVPTTAVTADNLGDQQSVPYTAEYYFYGAK